MKRSLFFLISLSMLLSSCGFFGGRHVGGDGNVVIQTRTANNFNSLDISSALDVEITQDSTYSVKVEVDNNLQQFIEVYQRGDVLIVKLANNTNIDPTGKMKVYVSAPSYRNIETSGACSIKSKNRLSSNDEIRIGMSGACNGELDLKAPKVSLDLSGASTVSLTGETKDFNIQGSGSSDVKAFGLLTENSDIDISGAGTVEVTASVKIYANASGASDIRYKGNAAVNSDVSGAGSVKKVN